jgi:hypothetical protein
MCEKEHWTDPLASIILERLADLESEEYFCQALIRAAARVAGSDTSVEKFIDIAQGEALFLLPDQDDLDSICPWCNTDCGILHICPDCKQEMQIYPHKCRQV